MAQYSDFVDYRLVEAFRSGDMKSLRNATRHLPLARGVRVNESGSYAYQRNTQASFRSVTEGPGHKTWLGEWLYLKTGRPYYDVMVWDTGLAAINDLITTGHMAITMTDDITAHSYKAFAVPAIRDSFLKGFMRLCQVHQMAIIGGETASLPFLMNPLEPAVNAPNMSASVTGILEWEGKEIRDNVELGSTILGVRSLGPQVNGYSSIIDYGLQLKEQFLTVVPGTDKTFGELAMEPTVSVARLIESLMDHDVLLDGVLPATGDGLRKLFRMGNFLYVIRKWPSVLPVFQYIKSLGMPPLECVTTFNYGIAYYLFVRASEVHRTIAIGREVGYEIDELGFVEDGGPLVDFKPEKLQIPPRVDQQ